MHGRQGVRVRVDQPELVADSQSVWRDAVACGVRKPTVRRLQRGAVPLKVQPFFILVGDQSTVGTILDGLIKLSIEDNTAIEVQKTPPIRFLEVPAEHGVGVVTPAKDN